MDALGYIALAVLFLPALIFITGFFDPLIMINICGVFWYLIGLPAIFMFCDKGEYGIAFLIILVLVALMYLQHRFIKRK